MKNFKRFRGVAAVLVALAVCMAPALAAGPKVEDFVKKIAELKRLPATDLDTAKSSLADAGVRLPGDLDFDAPLTQGDVVDISNAAGLNLSTSTPAAPFSSGDLSQFSDSWGKLIGGGDGDNQTNDDAHAADPLTKGKGKKLGLLKKSPSEPI